MEDQINGMDRWNALQQGLPILQTGMDRWSLYKWTTLQQRDSHTLDWNGQMECLQNWQFSHTSEDKAFYAS